MNRLFVGALAGELPETIVKISVTKHSFTYKMITPLHCACVHPNPNILKALLKQMPIFSMPDQQRRNLIHYAAANVNGEVVKFLLQNGADPNELDAQRITPLMIACKLGKIEVVRVLLEHFEGKRRAKEAAKKAKTGEFLKKRGKKSAKRRRKEESDEEVDEDEDENDIEVNFLELKSRSSWTALHFAAHHGSTECAEALIKAGANLEAKTSKGMVIFYSMTNLDTRDVGCPERTSRPSHLLR